MAGGSPRVGRWPRAWMVAVTSALVVGALMAAGAAAGGLEPPAVQRFGPSDPRDVPAGAPISIAFDRPVLAPLAERAVHIQPAVEGSFSWKGNTLIFTPSKGWARGVSYRDRKSVV